MVAIKNIAFISALVALVAAAPVADSNEVVAQEEYTVKDLESLLESPLVKRATQAGPALEVVLSLLTDVSIFLGQTLSNVLTLNLSAESDSLTNLLIGVNAEVIKLAAALGQVSPYTGLGNIIQRALINTGLVSVVLSLSTTVSALVAKLLKNGGQITPQQKAAIATLQSSITTLANAMQNQNLGTAVISTLQNVLQQLGKVL